MVSRLRLGFMVFRFKVFRVYGLKIRISRFKVYSFREEEERKKEKRKGRREGRKEKSKRRREGKEKEEAAVEKEVVAAAAQVFGEYFVEDDDGQGLGVKCN
ncbi:hypothetical protein M9H77_03465 [Catharanthus roseus]|uniref:Uncharacterized protein n=1 Tax=Catharanthus roseus TaxID=4058 RepID=A0ACC0CBA5_CATRO|nr:hypothetical protein M9H77_03465 [Catharanthus roseus]